MRPTTERKIKNILIRGLTDEDRQMISVLMAETKCRQASKALLKTAHSFTRILGIVKRQEDQIKALEKENRILGNYARQMMEANRKIEQVLITNNQS